MDYLTESSSNQSAPPRTHTNQFGTWLTVSEAVTYCSIKGLNRTPKTIRKWALRSHQDRENAELEVRREDIETGFRWSIERSSLDRKIFQEIEFEKRIQDAPGRPSAPHGEPVLTGVHSKSEESTTAHLAAPVQTSPDGFALQSGDTPNATNSDNENSKLVQSLRDQIRRLDEQVDFYREELRDRRTSTKALAEVIQAFRLNAENQNSRSQGSGAHHDIREPRRNDVGDNGTSAHS